MNASAYKLPMSETSDDEFALAYFSRKALNQLKK